MNRKISYFWGEISRIARQLDVYAGNKSYKWYVK